MNFPSITFDIEKHRKKFNKINPIFENQAKSETNGYQKGSVLLEVMDNAINKSIKYIKI